MIFGNNLLANKQWGADLAAPMLAWALGGAGLMSLYVTGLVGAALGTLSAMVFIMSANVTRDIIKLWRPQTSDRFLISLGYVLIALFLFLPFYWTLERPPELLALFMGLAAMGLGAIFFFVNVISYYWKGATKVGAMLTVIFGTVAALWGGWAVFGRTPALLGMGTMEWILIGGCAITYFGGSLLSKAPSDALLNKLFPEKRTSRRTGSAFTCGEVRTRRTRRNKSFCTRRRGGRGERGKNSIGWRADVVSSCLFTFYFCLAAARRQGWPASNLARQAAGATARKFLWTR